MHLVTSRVITSGHVTDNSAIAKTPKGYGSVLYKRSYGRSKFYILWEYAFSTFFAPVTSTSTRWPSYTNLALISWIYRMCENELPTSNLSNACI